MKKKIYFLALFLSMFYLASGQSQRLVLLEHFTQASCGPCATYNPSIHTLLTNNPDKITSIMYHTSWPGIDPMYNHNTVENGARTSYYSVNSVPNSVLDGNIYNGHPNGWNINTVNTRYAVASPFDLYIHHDVNTSEGTITVQMLIVATEDVDAGMKAQLAVIEKHIHFNSPPGSNGEVDFYNVMKKLLPNQGGVTLPAFESGDYMILQHVWEYQNVYDTDELAAVGFVQNNANKEVLQSANSSDEPFAPLYGTDVEVTGVANISLTNCTGKIQPEVTIRNNGSEALTSLEINYSMNGGDAVTYSWSGNLGFLEAETILLDESVFAVEPENVLEVVLESPNGQTDEYLKNNSREIEVDLAPLGQPTMVLYMILDDNPEEITWEVTNYEGDVIHSGGPYSNPGQTVLEQLAFESTNCYTFTIYDEGGDGLSQGGSVAFGYGSTYLINEVNFGSKAQAQFRIEFTGIAGSVGDMDFSIYPNPAGQYVYISSSATGVTHFTYSLVNTLGQVVLEGGSSGQLQPGDATRIDIDGIPAGIYSLQIKAGENTIARKLMISGSE